jgi:hypothetical protein
MRHRFLTGIAGVAVLAAITVVPVAAAGDSLATPPLAVHFEVQTSGVNGGLSGGPFTASGPAVAAGLICAAGDTIDAGVAQVSGWQSLRGINIQVVKQFSCADNGPTFLVKLQVRIDAKGDNFSWTVVDGAGAYARLHGSGSGVGLYPTGPQPQYGVLDVYDGGVHVD